MALQLVVSPYSISITRMNKRLNNFFGNSFNKWIFIITLLLSIVLIVVSFIIPPMGVIDASILTAVGELFAFAALGEVCAAIERGKTVSLSKNDVNLTVGDLPPKPDDDEMIQY